MKKYPDTVLLVFAKAPVQGQVNTRLIPDIGVEAATQLQEEFIHNRLQMLTEASLCDVVLMCAPDMTHDCFKQCGSRYDVRLNQQQGDDLGARITQGIKNEFKHYQYCVVIGTDAPALTASAISDAIDELHTGKTVVFIPAEDGGYVLVGLQQCVENLFQSIDWGTPAVLGQSIEKLQRDGISYSLMNSCWDVDRVADYERYIALKQQGTEKV